MTIAVVDYNAGNTFSVLFALERLGISATLTGDPATIISADGVIIPGVGAAGSAIKYLQAAGLAALLPSLTQPVLGICLGMQLLYEHSDENDTPCLGIIPGTVSRLQARVVPHTGWNQLVATHGPLFNDLPQGHNQYFVHSFAAPIGPHTLAVAEHDGPFSAAVGYKNFYGVQFHPEKSGPEGAQVIDNFLDIVKAKTTANTL
jgi:imidazole glycerol-phosphate synthase subunit HisH